MSTRRAARISGRRWCFTLNNWTQEELEHLRRLVPDKKLKYLCFGQEKAPDTGTLHLQGYFELASDGSRSLPFVRGLISDRAHFERAHGDAAANKEYCSKEGNFEEFGTPGGPSGRRSDIHGLRDFIKEAPSAVRTRDLLDSDHITVVAKYPRFVDLVNATYHPPGTIPVLDNWWFVGDTRTGKSQLARECKPHYVKPPGAWWCFYDNQPTVIIEEFSPANNQLTELKIWSDHYPFPAPTKGSHKFIRPKRVIVCSNYTIQECFPHPQDHNPVLARFTVLHFPILRALLPPSWSSPPWATAPAQPALPAPSPPPPPPPEVINLDDFDTDGESAVGSTDQDE